jgi:hypothetical protein
MRSGVIAALTVAMMATAGTALAHDHDNDRDQDHRPFGKVGAGVSLTLVGHLLSPDAPPVCRTPAGFLEPYANDCGASLVGQIDVTISQSVDASGVKTTTVQDLLYVGSDGAMVNCSAGVPLNNFGFVLGKDSVTVTISLATMPSGALACAGFGSGGGFGWGADCTIQAVPDACSGSWPIPNGGIGGTIGGDSTGSMTLTFTPAKKTYSYTRSGKEHGTHADGTRVNIKYSEYTTGATVSGTVYGKDLSVYPMAPTDNFRAEITAWRGDPDVLRAN